MTLLPANEDVSVMFSVNVSPVPLPTADEPAAVIEHWLLAMLVAVPFNTNAPAYGPPASPASFTR